MIRKTNIMVSVLAWVVCFAIGTMPVSAEPASDKKVEAVSMDSELNSIELAALGDETPFMEFEQPAPRRVDSELWNEFRVRGNERGFSVAVSRDFSTWSDLTSVFRPSRWKNPVRPGGPLSFVNLECWITDPGRTAKTFIGTAVVVGGIAAITSGSGGGDESAKGVAVSAPATTTAASPSTSTKKDEPKTESAPAESTSASAPPPAAPPAVEPPAPEPPDGGFVEET